MDKNAPNKAFFAHQHGHLSSVAALFNKETPEHNDGHSPLRGWDALSAAGDFEGGNIYFPELNVEIPYLPGDVIFLRGKILRHGIRPWVGKKRFSMAWFIHEDVFPYYKSPLVHDIAPPL